MFVSEYGHLSVCAGVCEIQALDIRSPGAGLTGICQLPNVGAAVTQIWVLCKSGA